MKLNKLFLLFMAGLTMTACSSDDEEMGNNLSGNGVVEVKIAAPQVRALVDATQGDNNSKVKVDGPITVKLTYGNGDTKSAEITTTTGGTHTVKFFDVKNPQKVEAWVNAGNNNGKGTTTISDESMQVLPAKIPAYGVSDKFNLTGKTETNDGKKYEMYGASVQMNIPVARLEISGIKHVHASTATGCKYKKLTINGIYLDKVATTANGDVVDYSWPAIMSADGQTITTPEPILKDEITGNNNFLAEGAVWPSSAEPQKPQAYAFNFYPVSQMPIVKIYFKEAEASDESNPVIAPRYAVIKSYNGNANFSFEAGKIYRITAVNLDDKNIIGDEEGNSLYGVDVTVTEAQWTVVGTTGEWVEQ